MWRWKSAQHLSYPRRNPASPNFHTSTKGFFGSGMVDGAFPDTCWFNIRPTRFRQVTELPKLLMSMWCEILLTNPEGSFDNIGDGSRLAWDCSARLRHWACLHFHKTTHFPRFSPAPMNAWSCLFTICSVGGVVQGNDSSGHLFTLEPSGTKPSVTSRFSRVNEPVLQCPAPLCSLLSPALTGPYLLVISAFLWLSTRG